MQAGNVATEFLLCTRPVIEVTKQGSHSSACPERFGYRRSLVLRTASTHTSPSMQRKTQHRVPGKCLGRSGKPAAAVTSASAETCGQAFSGLTQSRVSGLTPPQSLMPAASSADQLAATLPLPLALVPSSSGVRFGGACSFAEDLTSRVGFAARMSPYSAVSG